MMNAKAKSTVTTYFGLEVQVALRMEAWSLILYHGRKFIVETADLRSAESSVWDHAHTLSRSSSCGLALAS